MKPFKELHKEIRQQMLTNYGNIFRVPKLVKIVVNMGVGEAVADSKAIQSAVADMRAISGQQPVVKQAKKSVSTFKLREGMPIGCKVTLRGDKMFNFLEHLVFFALPRARDFRGISRKSFDGNGNLSLGLKEQIVFPEINYDKIDKVRGMDITLVTTAKTDQEAQDLLSALYLPFIK